MNNALGSVHSHRNVVIMGYAYDIGQGVDQSQYVGNMRYGKQFGLFSGFIQDLLQFFWIHGPRIVNIPHFKTGPGTFAHHLPGDNIGVVFGPGNHNAVSGPDVGLSERISQQVERGGRPAGKNHFVCRSGIDEFTYGRSGFFIPFGALHAQVMDSPVDVPVQTPLHFLQHVQYLPGFLGCSPIVQVNKRFPVYFL